MTVQQVIRDTAANHDIYIYIDGVLDDLDADPTYTVTDANGDSVDSGTATNQSTGIYRIVIDPVSDLNYYTVDWTGVNGGAAWGAKTYVEIVGGLLFTETQARAFDNSALSSTSDYPDYDIVQERIRITDRLEQWTERAWVPRYARVLLAGNGKRELSVRDGICETSTGEKLHRPGRAHNITKILTVTENGTTVTASNVEARGNVSYTGPTTGGTHPIRTKRSATLWSNTNTENSPVSWGQIVSG